MWRWEFCVGLGVWGLQERQLRGGGSCTQLGYPGLEALMEFCAVQHLWGGEGPGGGSADSPNLLVSLQRWLPNRPTSPTPTMPSSRAAEPSRLRSHNL